LALVDFPCPNTWAVMSDLRFLSPFHMLFIEVKTCALGPQLNVLLGKFGNHRWSLQFPVRAAIDTDFNYVGFLSEPHIHYEYRKALNEGFLRTKLDLGLRVNFKAL